MRPWRPDRVSVSSLLTRSDDGEEAATRAVACSADQHDIALIGDEGAAGEIADQGFVDRRVDEVEVPDVLGQKQLGDGELVFDGAGLLLRYLSLQQIADDLRRLVHSVQQCRA